MAKLITDDQYVYYVCRTCGYTLRTDGTAASTSDGEPSNAEHIGEVVAGNDIDTTCQHAFESTIETEPTCQSEGLMLFACSKCGSTYTAVIAKAAHKYYDTDPIGYGYKNNTLVSETCTNIINGKACGNPRGVYVAEVNGVKCQTLAEALTKVPNDGTETIVTLINSEAIEGNTGWTIAERQNVVLDLNGYTLKNLVTSSSKSQALTNNGTLTIKDSSDIYGNGSGTGLFMNDCAADAVAGDYWTGSNNYTTNVITNNGILTINSGKIMNTCHGNICYCVDDFKTCTINGGWLYNYFTNAIRVGLYNEAGNILTINNGIIEGYNAIWIQNPDDVSAPSCNVTLNGGIYKTTEKNVVAGSTKLYNGATSIYNTGYESYGYDPSNIHITINGGEFYENIKVQGTKSHIKITGGLFHGYFYSAANDTVIIGGTFNNAHIVIEAGWIYDTYAYASSLSYVLTWVKNNTIYTTLDDYAKSNYNTTYQGDYYIYRQDYNGYECYVVYYYQDADDYNLFEAYNGSSYKTIDSTEYEGYVTVVNN